MMYPWEKDVFDLFDEAMEYACESGVWVEDTDPEEEDEQSSSKKNKKTY